VDEQNKWESEEQRKKLEVSAKVFAHKHNCKLGTFEFIRAIEEELADNASRREQWNNPEVRMEEWAAHQYAGGGSESYFDDLNYENANFEGESDSLENILEWLRTECPLLMAKYEEKKLSGEWAESEAVFA
jgi:hypothetical protein